MKYKTEIILIIIATLLMNSSLLAQDKPVFTYTGIEIDYRVAIPIRDVMNLFSNAGYSLGLDGTNQTVQILAQNFIDTKYPKNAAAIAIGTNVDIGVRIIVNTALWSHMSHERKMYILLHELGHDYFNLPHSDDKNSIMYYQLPNRINYKDVIKGFKELLQLCKDR